MMAPLRIAHMLPSFAWGGTQALTVLFAEHAPRLGVDFTVISLADTANTPYAAQLQERGAQVVVLDGASVLDPRRILRLARLLRDRRIDLLHTNLMRPNTLGPLAGAAVRCPIIAGLHSLPAQDTARVRLRAKLEALAVRKAAGVISCAQSIATAEAKRLAPHHIQVLSNPAPALGPDRPPRPRDQPLHFITVGRLSAEKGFDLLLDAAAQLRQSGHDFRVSIVGGGHLHDELHAQRAALGLHDVVTFTGPRDDIPALLQAADVYLSPSRFEGLSIALLEAMAQGLAVIATPVGDTADLVTPDTGTLIPIDDSTALADAMARLITAPEGVRTAGIAAQKRIAETRAPGPWAAALVEIYRTTIAAYHEGRR